jgi:hypothetical protein
MIRLVICSGIKRSASTWSFNVCRHLAEARARVTGARFLSEYANHTDDLIKRLSGEAAAKDGDLIGVIKAHEPGKGTVGSIRRGKIRNVYTIRDPRDCLASMEQFWQREKNETFERRINEFLFWLRYAEIFLADGASHVVRYEDMIGDPAAEIRRIAKYLDLKCDAALIADIAEKTSPEASQSLIDEMNKGKADADGRLFNSLTQLHERHLGGGTVGRWRAAFEGDTLVQVERAFAPWLEKLGYAP